MKINLKHENHEYPAGSMFWFRPQALEPFFSLNLNLNQFEKQSEKKIDGTLAHAIERLFLDVVEKAGFAHRKVLFRPTINDKNNKNDNRETDFNAM